MADPYRDLDVIDARAPRFNQAVIGSPTGVAVVPTAVAVDGTGTVIRRLAG
jgi:hypothetical protein